MARSGKRKPDVSSLRIIGGQWRGRKLSFVPGPGLRPTADRVRETLFNWLAPDIRGAHCLDLFTGSGALGLEALSRGGAHCDFVDSSAPAISHIKQHLQTLDACSRARCVVSPALDFLDHQNPPYDLVFIDPPFGEGMVEPVCKRLAERELLSPACRVYIEMSAREAPPRVPEGWALHREKKAGEVCYRLYVEQA